MSSTTDTAANRTETTVSNVASTMSGYISNLKDKYPGVTSKVGDGMEKARSIATEVGSEIQKSASSNNVNSPLPSDFESEVQKAAKILSSFTDVEGGLEVIPRDIIVNAKGLAIFTVVKAGFFWSGRVGSGLVVARLPDNSWSSPSLINIGGVGFGAQVGADVTDFVIILNTEDAVNAFSRGENLTLGGNLAVSAGPVGIGHEYSGSLIEGAALFSYSKSKGLFAGVSVEGTIIIERKDANKTFYDKEISAKDILCGKTDKPSSIDILYETITRAEEEKEPKAIN